MSSLFLASHYPGVRLQESCEWPIEHSVFIFLISFFQISLPHLPIFTTYPWTSLEITVSLTHLLASVLYLFLYVFLSMILRFWSCLKLVLEIFSISTFHCFLTWPKKYYYGFCLWTRLSSWVLHPKFHDSFKSLAKPSSLPSRLRDSVFSAYSHNSLHF